MHNLWLTVVVISCGLRVSSDVIENLKLHEVFRKPKDFSRVNFDHLEILERNNFKGNHEHDEACGLSKLHPKSVANAQVMLRFGGDDIKGKNCIGKNPSEDLSTRFGVPYCQQCQQPHYQILNQYKPPCQLMPPYPLGQYPVPAYFPLSLPQNPYYPYYCPCFNNVPGMIPNESSSAAAQNCPFLGGNVQTNIESAINANHPKILQATDLTDECVPENNEADDDDDDDDDEPIVVPDVGETFKRPKGYKEPQLSEYERDYEKQLGPGADNKPKPTRDDDDYGMDDEPIVIPDVGESFKRPKGYKNPPLSKFEKDYEKQLGPGADKKPQQTRDDDDYGMDDEPIVIPDVGESFKRPKGYKNPPLSKFEKDYEKQLGPGADKKPQQPRDEDDYGMDDEPIVIPDVGESFKRPKGYKNPPLSKFEKDYEKELGPGADKKPQQPRDEDDYGMDDEPIIIPDVGESFKRPKGYKNPPLSKFEKDYEKQLGPGADKKPQQTRDDDDYGMDDEPIIIPDVGESFKRPKGYKNPPLSKFEKDYEKQLGPGADNKPKPTRDDDDYGMDDEPIVIPDVGESFKRPKGYKNPPLSKFEKDYEKQLGPGADNKPQQPRDEDDYGMDDEPIVIPDVGESFKRPKGYKNPPLSKFEKDYEKELGPGADKKPQQPRDEDDYGMDDEPIIIPDVGESFKRPKGYKNPPLSKFEKDYEKQLGPGADKKPQQTRDDDDYGMDDEPIIIPDVGESFKRPKGYKNPPLSKFEKDYEKQLGPGADNKPKPTRDDDDYGMDDEPIVIPDVGESFKRPKGYKNPPLSKFEKDYEKQLGPGADNKPKPTRDDDDYGMDDEPIIIPDVGESFKKPKGYKNPPLSKFEKDYEKQLGPGADNKPQQPRDEDDYGMDDEPIIIPDVGESFKRPKGYKNPPLSKFEKDYEKQLGPGADNRPKPKSKPKPTRDDNDSEMEDEPIVIPDVAESFKRPKGYTDPPLSQFEKDYIKQLGPGADNKPKPKSKPKPKQPRDDDDSEMDDEPIIIPDVGESFKRPEGYTDPPLSQFEKDYIKQLGPGADNKPKPKPKSKPKPKQPRDDDDDSEMDDEPIIIPDVGESFKRPEGYTDPPLSQFEKDYIKQLGPGADNKPKPKPKSKPKKPRDDDDDDSEMDDEPIIIPDVGESFKKPKGYTDPPLSQFEKDYIKQLGPGADNKPKPKPKSKPKKPRDDDDDDSEMDDEPIIIPDVGESFKKPKGYTDPPLSQFEKDYIKQLGPGADNKPKPKPKSKPKPKQPRDDDDDSVMDDQPIIIPDVGESFKRPKGYKNPPLSKFEKDYEKQLGPGADNKPQQPREDDGSEMDDEPIIIPDVGKSFKRPKGYRNPPLSKFEKDYEKQLGPGADNKPQQPREDDGSEMDDEPIIIPDVGESFKRPKGYKNPPLSKFEKDYEKQLGPGADNKPQQPREDDDSEMNDEPIAIPDIADSFKRPKGYTDPPLSNFEKDYIKQLGPGADNKPKPTTKTDEKPCVAPSRPKGTTNNRGKGKRTNNKNKPNKKPKAQTKPANKPISLKPPSKKDNLDAPTIKEEKPVFDATAKTEEPLFEDTIKTESPIEFPLNTDETIFDQNVKPEDQLDITKETADDKIFIQKIPIPDFECDQQQKPPSVRRELEHWLNKSLVPYECDKCGKKLLVTYPLTEDQPHIHIGGVPLAPSKCPCCQLKGFCDCQTCRSHRDPSIPYGQRFPADVDSLSKMAGDHDNWSPGGYYSDPYRKILFKHPSVFNFITHANVVRREPHVYELVQKEVPKLVPTETFLCCKVPGNRMLCQRQYLAGNEPVLIENGEA